MRTKRKTVDIEGAVEHARTELAEHSARIAQLESDLHSFKCKLDFSERRNNIFDLQYSKLSKECASLKRQIASGGLCSGEMVLRLANASKCVFASIHDLNRHTALVQKAIRDTSLSKAVALAERLQTFLHQEVVKLSISVNKEACHTVASCNVVLLLVRRLCGNA